MMYRILQSTRILSSSIVIRFSSTNKIPIRNQPNIDEDDDDDENVRSKKIVSSKDYIFADSKSSRFKEKNKRKQSQWLKELQQRQITPKTPLTPFLKQEKSKSEKVIEEKSEEKVVR